jgi:hypothetical protein
MLIHADVKQNCQEWVFVLDAIVNRLLSPDGESVIDTYCQRSNVAVSCMYAQFAWEVCGEQVFLLGPNQCRMFREMDLTNIGSLDIKYPFDTFYVALEGCGLTMKASTMGDEPLPEGFHSEHAVQGVYVSRTKQIMRGSKTRLGTMKKTLARRVDSTMWSMDVSVDENELVDGTSFVVWAANSNCLPEDDILYVMFIPDDYVEKLGSFELAVDEMLKTATDVSDSGMSIDENEYNRQSSALAMRMAIGMCVYLECRQAIVTVKDYSDQRRTLERKIVNGGKKGAKAERMLTKIPTSTIRVIDPSLKYVSPEHASVRAHWRRAHTRMQWLGSKSDELGNARHGERQERRWIPATIVNPDSGDTAKRTYVV